MGTGLLRRLRIARRASVAVTVAVLLPGMFVMIAVGVEVAGWEATQVEAQRVADLSAMAGAINYQQSGSKKTAATFAARMAQLNGGAGTTTPGWNSATNTLTDNEITVQVVNGVASSADAALKVIYNKTIGATISSTFSTVGSYIVTGTSTAELVTAALPTGSGGGQPCLVALAGDNGITSGTDITIEGSVTVNAMNCTIRSNDGVETKGSANVTASAVYAGGTVTSIGSSSITGSIYQNQGQISDPYAGDTTLQTALASANSATATGGINCTGSAPTCTGPAGSVSCGSGGCTIQPGTYSGLSISGSGNVTLSSGLYVFTGSIQLTGSGTVSGSAITILMAGGSSNTLSVAGSTSFVLSAASTATATNSQIPGIVFASLSTGGSTVYTGSSSSPFVGVIYYPNGEITHTGSSYNGSPGCAEVIAKTIELKGSTTFDVSTCSTYGAYGFNSLPAVKNARVVR